jgi:hypothetical protein
VVAAIRFDSRKFGTSRIFVIQISLLSLSFQCLACGLRVASSSTESRDGNNAATPWLAGPNNHNDDLEDRAIGAAENPGFYAKWAHEGGGGHGVGDILSGNKVHNGANVMAVDRESGTLR